MSISPLSTSPLDQKLLQVVPPLDGKVRYSILRSVWNLQLSKDGYDDQSHRWDAYFRHYEEHCEQLSPGGISVLTHQDMLDTVELLKRKTRTACVDELRKTLPSHLQALVEDIIDFTANTLLLVNVSRWRGDQSLKDFVHSHFVPASAVSDKSKLPTSFNLQTLEEVADIKVIWTTDLRQHLSLRHDDTKVALFHHVAVLDLYKDAKLDIIPEDVLEETRKTLALLLPRTTKEWFRRQEQTLQRKRGLRKQGERVHLDPKAGAGEHLRADERSLESFSHWRDRLIILKETFDDHEPRSIRQFWKDDRKSVQWWTFWIALLVFLIAIVQCIEGALQVYKAYHPSP